MSTLRIALAQLPVAVGDFAGNTERLAAAMTWADAVGAVLLLTPEMGVTGYPAEDLLTTPGFIEQATVSVAALAGRCAGLDVTSVVGAPLRVADLPAAGNAVADGGHLDALPRPLRNAAVVLHAGRAVAAAAKRRLPTYSVFDDARHFAPGAERTVLLDVAGVRVAVVVCEDLWDPQVTGQAAADGAQVIVAINASPFHAGKQAERERLVTGIARRTGCAVAYVNGVGAQDEVVFDGASLVAAPGGALLARGASFTTDRLVLDVPVGVAGDTWRVDTAVPARTGTRPELPAPQLAERLGEAEATYSAIVLGLREYFTKTGLTRAVLGLSGGIDSALVAALAVDALGPDNVWGVGLPGPFSSEGSLTDAAELAANLGIRFDAVGIGGGYAERLTATAELLTGADGAEAPSAGLARENLQARLRAATLMLLANAWPGTALLTTGNKSESSVGYFTLYGDSCGGINPIGDVWKTSVTTADGTVMPGVYELARWRNAHATSLGDVPPIPLSTLTKPPSAELSADQRDTDSLPPYEVLDPLLAAFLEEHTGADECVARLVAGGMEPQAADAVTRRVLRLIEVSEWKRRQVPFRIKVTRLAFGRDRRMPLANAYRVQPAAGSAPSLTAVPTAPDTATPDTATPDTAAPDTAAPDTAAPDSAAPHAPAADTPRSAA